MNVNDTTSFPCIDETREEYTASEFGGFADYFRRKKIKLQNQNEQIQRDNTTLPRIFEGCSIFVNGYTKPSTSSLREMVLKHGGIWKQYMEGKTSVTHIVAAFLTPQKRVEFAKYKVVKPEWIVDSVQAQRLLPWSDYRTIEDISGQTVLQFNGDKSQIAQRRVPLDSYKNGASRRLKPLRLSNSQSNENSLPKLPVSSAGLAIGGNQLLKTPSHVMKPLKFTLSTPVHAKNPVETILQDTNTKIGESIKVVAMTKQQQRENLFTTSLTSEIKPMSIMDSNPRIALPIGQSQNVLSYLDVQVDSISESTTITNEPSNLNYSESVSPTEDGFIERSTHQLKRPLTAEQHNSNLLAIPSIRKSTSVDPDFLETYFGNSRLHHLSTWKANLKTEIQQLAKTSKRLFCNPQSQRFIMHVDFDSFFASISLLSRPDLADKPVCVGHGGSMMGEIASCNYKAREFGVKNGMWMKEALRRCPQLTCLPYDFNKYEEVSRVFYGILVSISADALQPVSVDEALLDVTSCVEGPDCHHRADALAQRIRDEIREKTSCEVSIGIGSNILLAKLALKRAKPAGQFQLKPLGLDEFLADFDVRNLPGVGFSIGRQLEMKFNVKDVGQLRSIKKEDLRRVFGNKTGEKLYKMARGIDDTEVDKVYERKSVSVEVNWGIRFENKEQADKFVFNLTGELHKRLLDVGCSGRQLTLKVMRRAAEAPLDPPKHLGHGICDSFSKSTLLGFSTNDHEILAKEAQGLLRGFGIPPGELRGLAVQMGKLVPVLPRIGCRTQSKLAFPELEEPCIRADYSLASLNDSPPKRTPFQGHENSAPTLLEIPTQIDSSILEALPEDLQRDIKQIQKNKLQYSINEKDVLPSPSEIDREVLNALPPSVKKELTTAYARRSYSKSPKKVLAPSSNSPGRKRTISKPKPFTLTQGKYFRENSTSAISHSNYDLEILAKLPKDIREEVIRNAQRELVAARRRKEQEDVPSKQLPVFKIQQKVQISTRPIIATFQKLSDISDLRQLIHEWFHECKDDGPHMEDVAAFSAYIHKVIKIEKNLLKAESVIRWFLQVVGTGQGSLEWNNAVEALIAETRNACRERGIGMIQLGYE